MKQEKNQKRKAHVQKKNALFIDSGMSKHYNKVSKEQSQKRRE